MNVVDEIFDIIMSEDKLVIVLVLGEGCYERETELEHWLVDKVKQLDVKPRILRMCFDEYNMIFPRPLTECIYYFAPKNVNPLFLRVSKEAVDRFLDDVVIANKMIAGVTYTDAIYDNEEDKKLIKNTEKLLWKKENKISKYPNTSKMIKNFAKDMWQSAKSAGKGLPVLVDPEVAAERYSICEQCPNLTEEARCTECGCFMKKKVNLAASSCPIEKWDSVQ
jgi:hypothetical protein